MAVRLGGLCKGLPDLVHTAPLIGATQSTGNTSGHPSFLSLLSHLEGAGSTSHSDY